MTQLDRVRYDGTMEDLHRYFKKFKISNPQLIDPKDLITRAVEARWPGADPRDLMEDGEENWLRRDMEDMVRDASRDMNKWIDTTAQGDLFNQYPVRVPRWFLIDGKQTPYYEVTLQDALPYLRAREAATRAEADALQSAADEKRRIAGETHMQVEQTLHLIQIAKDNGIDPAKVRYERQDDTTRPHE